MYRGTTWNFFREVSGHLDKLEKLNTYLQNVNSFLVNSTTLNTTLLEVLGRTKDVGTIVENIGETVNDNKKFQEYVQSHFTELKEHGTMMLGTVGKVDDVLGQSIEQLKDSFKVQIESYRNFANEQIDALRGELKVEQGMFNQLMHLEALKNNFEEINSKTAAQHQALLDAVQNQHQALLSAVQEMNKKLVVVNESVKGIERRKTWMDRIFDRWFKTSKKSKKLK